MGIFGNLLTAMVTPFDKEGKVNYNEAQKIASYLLENGSDGIVVAGTTGESPTLSKEEKRELFKAVGEVTKGKAKIIAGTGSNSTQDSIELTNIAEEVGVDGVMLVVPYYNKPPQAGLLNHFSSIAKRTKLPVMLYNVPSRSGVNMEAETTIKLAEIANIVAIKEASGDLEQVSKIVKNTSDDFYVYSGDDATTLPMMAVGATGVVSVAAHIAGKKIKQMIMFFHANELEKARDIHFSLLPIFDSMFVATNPIPVKTAVGIKGFSVGSFRSPLVEPSEVEKQEIGNILKQNGLI